MLGRRDLTAAELTSRLMDKGYAPQDVAEQVERLIADRALDDRRTATAYADTAARIKGRGRLRIRRELEARGVSRGIIDDVLAQVLPAGDEMDAIRRVIARRKVTDRSSPAERRRAFQHLLRRGFSPAAISKALRLHDDADE